MEKKIIVKGLIFSLILFLVVGAISVLMMTTEMVPSWTNKPIKEEREREVRLLEDLMFSSEDEENNPIVIIQHLDDEGRLLFEEEIIEDIYLGEEYIYNVEEPEYQDDDGLWWLTEEIEVVIEKIEEGKNIIIIEYDKLMAEVMITLATEEGEIIAQSMEEIQVGTEFTYEVAKVEIEYYGLLFETSTEEVAITVEKGINEIEIIYSAVMAEVMITLVTEESEIITQSMEEAQVGTTYIYEVKNEFYYMDDEGLYQTEIKEYEIIVGRENSKNEILVEYEKVAKYLVIRYFDEEADKVINTIYQVMLDEEEYEYETEEYYTDEEGQKWIARVLSVMLEVEDGENVVVVVYDRLIETLEVRYIDVDTGEVIFEDEITGQVGTNGTYEVAKEYEDDGLFWITTDYGIKEYTIGETVEIVVYYEKVQADPDELEVTVEFRELITEMVIDTISLGEQEVGTEHTYEPPADLNGGEWILTGPASVTYTVEADQDLNILVIYYEKAPVGPDELEVTVEFRELITEMVIDTISLGKQEVDTEHTYEPPADLNGGEWILAGPASITYTVDADSDLNILVIYYEKEPVESDEDVVKVKYIDAETDEVIFEDEIIGLVGETGKYLVSEIYTYNNFSWITTDYGLKEYTIGDTVEIVIVYNKVVVEPEKAQVIIEYIDNDDHNNVLKIEILEDRIIGTTITHTVEASIEKNDERWVLVNPLDGTVTHVVSADTDENIIRVFYEKAEEIDEALVIITCLDIDTDEIIEIINLEKQVVGTIIEYTLDATLQGGKWILIGSTIREHTVVMGLNDITVYYEKAEDYVEQANVIIRYVEKDNTSNIIHTEDIGTRLVGEVYEYMVPAIHHMGSSEWTVADITNLIRTHLVVSGSNIITIEYEQTKSQITIKHQNLDGSEAAPSQMLLQRIGIYYTASKTDITNKCVSKVYVDGVERTELKYPINECDILVLKGGNEVIFVYEADTRNLNIPDRVQFDLRLSMNINRMLVTESGKNQTINVGETGTNIAKVDINSKKISSTTLKVAYTLKVTNAGFVEGYATELTNYIPDGFIFVKEDNPAWREVISGVAVTNMLANTLLKPGETAEVEIILQWKNIGSNIGLMTNRAEITETYNAQGLEDIKMILKSMYEEPAETHLLIAIKTGGPVMISVIGIILIVILSGSLIYMRRFTI